MIGRKLYELVRDWRANVPGFAHEGARPCSCSACSRSRRSRLVYFFSLNAINRSIDSWFDVDIKQGLDDALSLSRAALSLRTRELLGAHDDRGRRAARPSATRIC